MREQLDYGESEDEEVASLEQQEEWAFYDAHIAMFRERLCADHQLVWDRLSYESKCGFIRTMIEREVIK